MPTTTVSDADVMTTSDVVATTDVISTTEVTAEAGLDATTNGVATTDADDTTPSDVIATTGPSGIDTTGVTTDAVASDATTVPSSDPAPKYKYSGTCVGPDGVPYTVRGTNPVRCRFDCGGNPRKCTHIIIT